jgi:hypothetical protein
MTDEEQKKLCEDLRELGQYNSEGDLRFKAANEIERLQRELNSVLNLLYQESEHRAIQDQRLQRLEQDVEALRRM